MLKFENHFFVQTDSQGLSLIGWAMLTQGIRPAPVHCMVPAFPTKAQVSWGHNTVTQGQSLGS